MQNSSAIRSIDVLLPNRHDWQLALPPETVPTGIAGIDQATNGLPRGCITEIFGPPSSGRTTLLTSILAQAAARDESCALIDAEDAFDPIASAAAGVRLDRLLWVRCTHNAEHALKAADLLIQGGGFGLIAMNLADTPVKTARRISLTSWFRLRRAVEHTSTVLVVISRQSNAETCATLQLDCAPDRFEWTGARHVSRLLSGIRSGVRSTKKRNQCSLVYTAPAI
jgi:hypothetical protein